MTYYDYNIKHSIQRHTNRKRSFWGKRKNTFVAVGWLWAAMSTAFIVGTLVCWGVLELNATIMQLMLCLCPHIHPCVCFVAVLTDHLSVYERCRSEGCVFQLELYRVCRKTKVRSSHIVWSSSEKDIVWLQLKRAYEINVGRVTKLLTLPISSYWCIVQIVACSAFCFFLFF